VATFECTLSPSNPRLAVRAYRPILHRSPRVLPFRHRSLPISTHSRPRSTEAGSLCASKKVRVIVFLLWKPVHIQSGTSTRSKSRSTEIHALIGRGHWGLPYQRFQSSASADNTTPILCISVAVLLIYVVACWASASADIGMVHPTLRHLK